MMKTNKLITTEKEKEWGSWKVETKECVIVESSFGWFLPRFPWSLLLPTFATLRLRQLAVGFWVLFFALYFNFVIIKFLSRIIRIYSLINNIYQLTCTNAKDGDPGTPPFCKSSSFIIAS